MSHKCDHINAKSYTFRCTNETITLCPDKNCTRFDAQRKRVLTGEITTYPRLKPATKNKATLQEKLQRLRDGDPQALSVAQWTKSVFAVPEPIVEEIAA